MAKPHDNVVARCPKCGAPIGDTHPYTWCSNCGGQLPAEVTAKLFKIQAMPTGATAKGATSAIRHFRSSTLSGGLRSLAILDFTAAAIGVLMAFLGSASETGTGVMLFAVGISGAFLFLALAKVLDYLGEAVFRLRNIEEFATPRPNQAMQRPAGRSDV